MWKIWSYVEDISSVLIRSYVKDMIDDKEITPWKNKPWWIIVKCEWIIFIMSVLILDVQWKRTSLELRKNIKPTAGRDLFNVIIQKAASTSLSPTIRTNPCYISWSYQSIATSPSVLLSPNLLHVPLNPTLSPHFPLPPQQAPTGHMNTKGKHKKWKAETHQLGSSHTQTSWASFPSRYSICLLH